MNKKIAALSLALVFALPLISSAQSITDLYAQVNAIAAQVLSLSQQIPQTQAVPNVSAGSTVQGVPICPDLKRNIGRGATGDDVLILQAFLGIEPTGFFGPVTEAAVQNWQKVHGVISTGDPLSTGFGVVGPKTRSALAHSCASAGPSVSSSAQTTGQIVSVGPACTDAPRPINACTNTWQAVTGANGCATGWQCAAVSSGAQGDQAPTISQIVGSTTVVVNTLSVWTIQASDREGSVGYNITWGDESQSVDAALNALAGVVTFSTGNTFSHTYKTVGTYTINATVQDSIGNRTTKTLSVIVQSAAGGTGSQNISNTNTSLGSVADATVLSATPGTLFLMHDDRTCPMGTTPLAVGYCMVPFPNTTTINLCPAGTHQTAASGCVQDEPKQPQVVYCPAHTMILAVAGTNGCAIAGPCSTEGATTYITCNAGIACTSDPGWAVCRNGEWTKQ